MTDLRTGDTLVIWKIDRLGRNLRDLTMPKTSLPWAVVVSTTPLVNDCTRRRGFPGWKPAMDRKAAPW